MMKHNTKLLLAALLLLGSGQSALAASKAGDQVVNTATVKYKVNDVEQTDQPGSSTFVVDRKVDIVVDWDESSGSVVPKQEQAVLKFTVTNNTNDQIDIKLVLEQLSGENNGNDFNADDLEIWIDDGNGTFDANNDELLSSDGIKQNVDQDQILTVFVVGKIPDEANGSEGHIALIAIAYDGNQPLEASQGADDPENIDTVFADGDGDGDGDLDAPQNGAHTDIGKFIITSAVVNVQKTMAVICEHADDDGECLENFSAAGEFKPIPGSLIQYCISVHNTGDADATEVVISDDLDHEHLQWIPNSIKVTTAPTATCELADPAAAYNAADSEDDDANPNGSDPDRASFDADPATYTLTATGGTVGPNEKFVVMFRVKVK